MDARPDGDEGTDPQVRPVDVMALWFARPLAWIVCIMMFPIGLAALTGGIVRSTTTPPRIPARWRP